MKQLPFAPAVGQEAAPVPRSGGNAEVVREPGAQPAQLADIAREAHLPLQPDVDERNRRHHRRNGQAGNREITEDSRPRQSWPHEFDADHHADRKQEEIGVVGIR